MKGEGGFLIEGEKEPKTLGGRKEEKRKKRKGEPKVEE